MFFSAAIEHRADPVAVAGEQPCQHCDKFSTGVTLAPGTRTKIDRGAQVQHKPGGHFPVFGEHAHMGRVLPRSDVPVDVAHIVMELVFAQVGQVHAGAPQQGAVVALEHAVQPLEHGPLKAMQQLFSPGTQHGVQAA
jgi:hypothetical protein